MKIGIFTDSHYSSQEITCGKRYNSKSLQKIKDAFDMFKKENCELIISLGDLIDREDSHEKEISNLKQIAKEIKALDIPFICLMGNHDAFAFSCDEFYDILGGYSPNNIYEKDGKNLLFLDACYFKNGNHYQPGDSNWKDTYYPYAKDLKKLLASLDGETYIFMHQNIDPTIPKNHCLANAKKIRRILRKRSTVKTVYQGHYHKGSQFEQKGIKYITFPAMCENDNAYFIIDI